MSETLMDRDGISVTRIAGGVERGICYQLTQGRNYVQLTVAQFDFVRRVIEADIQDRAERAK